VRDPAGLGPRLTASTPWRIAMASAVGTSHIASGVPCQDSHFHLALNDVQGQVVTILSVSDGAAALPKPRSDRRSPARPFVKLVADYVSAGGLVDNISRELASRWVAGIVYRLSLKAWGDNKDPRDYACTLWRRIAASARRSSCRSVTVAIVISDGWTTAWRHVFWPQHGEFRQHDQLQSRRRAHSR